MIETLEELKHELSAGRLVEHRHTNVELKESWKQEVGKKISANGNKLKVPVTWIVIGVNDKGQMVTRDSGWAKKTEAELSEHLNRYLDPHQTCQLVETLQIGLNWIIVLKIVNPGVVVCWNKAAFKSSGTTIAEMQPQEVMQLTVSLPGLNDFSAQPWTGASNSSMVESFCKRVADRHSATPLTDLNRIGAEAALQRLEIKGRNVSKLLFGTATFRVIYNDAAGVPQRNETLRPLYRIFRPEFYTDVEQWARRFQMTNQSVYPIRAFHEAVANAVAHAAYFERDGEIIVEVSHDRICISNLCTRESAYFANKWFSRSHKTVNYLLMETLRLAGHVDELGRGKLVIFSEYIKAGRPVPRVSIEGAGRYSRWRLTLPAAPTDDRHLRLFGALEQHYGGDQQKALMAFALILWRNESVADIRNYIDGESGPTFAAILADIHGATYYHESGDKIFLNRWARLLLEEGVDSKSLNEQEDEHLYNIAQSPDSGLQDGYITPGDIRRLGHLGDTGGAKSLSSKILKQWEVVGKVRKVKHGQYQLTPQTKPVITTDVLHLFDQNVK